MPLPLYLISQLLQNYSDLLALLALDLDHAILDCPTYATLLLQLLCQGIQVFTRVPALPPRALEARCR